MASIAKHAFNSLRSRLTPETPLFGEQNPVKPENRSLINKLIGDRTRAESFSPQALQQTADEYLPNIGLGKDVTFSADAFSEHLKGRTQDFKGFKEAKTPSDEVISEKLLVDSSDPEKKEAVEAVRNALNDALKTSDQLIAAKKKYEESIATFQNLVKKIPETYQAADLIGAMKSIVDKGKQKIEAQQKQEIELLNAKFADPAFNNHLKKALVITDAQVEDVKKGLIDNLTGSHKKQIEAFDKSTQGSLKALHSAAANQLIEFLFIAELYKNDSKMRNMIENIAEINKNTLLQPQRETIEGKEKALASRQKTFEANQADLVQKQTALNEEQKAINDPDPAITQANQETFNKNQHNLALKEAELKKEKNALAEEQKSVHAAREAFNKEDIHTEVNLNDSKSSISSVRLEQLTLIQVAGGEPIKPQKDANGQIISYKLDMGMRFANPRYYLKDQDEKDLLLLAQVIRASGSTSITMKITASNPEVAEKRARAAYEACIKTGFPPEKIQLSVNGKLLAYKEVEKDEKDGQPYKSIEKELFAKHPKEFQALQEKSKTVQQELEKITKVKETTPGVGLDKIKEEIKTIRAATQPKQVAPPAKDESQLNKATGPNQ